MKQKKELEELLADGWKKMSGFGQTCYVLHKNNIGMLYDVKDKEVVLIYKNIDKREIWK